MKLGYLIMLVLILVLIVSCGAPPATPAPVPEEIPPPSATPEVTPTPPPMPAPVPEKIPPPSTSPEVTPTPAPVTYEITLSNAEGSRDVVETDSLVATVTRSDGAFEEYSYRWYRNRIALEGIDSARLSNDAMKTFTGNPEEYTPKSGHTDHAIRGYEFKVEVFNSVGEKMGESSVIIDGPKFEGEMKGINVSTWRYEWASPEKVDHSLATLLRTNANWLSIWSIHFQDGPDATEIYAKTTGDPTSLMDEQVIYLINKAHELGFRVIYYPQIWIAYPDGSGSPAEREKIVPSNEWFAAYKEFIVQRAEIASETGVESFTIGVELTSTERREDKWCEVIAAVREHYPGPIVYSPIACHLPALEHVQNIGWLTSLDYLGLSMNLETRSGNYEPGVSELAVHYEMIAQKVEEIYSSIGKEVIILETCVPSRDGCTISPRDWDEATPDFQEQADYYEAFFQVFGNKPWVKGIFWNQWNTSQESWYQNDPYWPHDVIFLNKPAERVLTSWYQP